MVLWKGDFIDLRVNCPPLWAIYIAACDVQCGDCYTKYIGSVKYFSSEDACNFCLAGC